MSGHRSHYQGYDWIKVKRYFDDPTLSWEERYARLAEHHRHETEFLIAEVRKLAAKLDDTTDRLFDAIEGLRP